MSGTDIKQLIPRNEYDALIAADAPSAANPFATMADLVGYGTDTKIPTGIPWDERVKFKVDVAYSAPNVVVTMSGNGGNTSFKYYIEGVEYTMDLTVPVVTSAAAADGVWFFKIDSSNVINLSQNPWSIYEPDVLLWNFYYDAGTTTVLWVGEERHTAGRDIYQHARNHAQGAIYASGLLASHFNSLAPSLYPTNNTDAYGRAQFNIASGVFFDEDIRNNIVTSASSAALNSTTASPSTDWDLTTYQYLGVRDVATGGDATHVNFTGIINVKNGQAITVFQGDTTTLRTLAIVNGDQAGTNILVTGITATPVAGDIILVGSRIPIYYIDNVVGSTYHWKKLTTTDFLAVSGGAPVTAATIGAAVAQYNNASAGTLVNATAGRYYPVYLCATNFTSEPVIAILGQAQSTNNNLNTALSETPWQFSSIIGLGNLGIQEIVPFYRLTYEYNTTATFTTTKVRLRDITFINTRVSTTSGTIIGGGTTSLPGSSIYLDTTNFNRILSVTDTTAQAAFDTLDNLAVKDGGGAATQVAFWTDNDTINGDSLFTFSTTTKFMTVNGVVFGNSPTITGSEAVGTTYWDVNDVCLSSVYVNSGGNTVIIQHGQEIYYHAKCDQVATIADGEPVMFSGTDGASGHLKIKTADIGSVGFKPEYFMGISTMNLATGNFGKVTFFGKVRGIDTTGATFSPGGLEAWADGDILYMSNTPGKLTKTLPTTYPIIMVAAVVNAALNGTLFVRPSITHIDGSGTTNYVTKWTGVYNLGNSIIRDDGSNVAIGAAPSASSKLLVSTTSDLYACYFDNSSNVNDTSITGIFGAAIHSGAGVTNAIGVYAAAGGAAKNVGVDLNVAGGGATILAAADYGIVGGVSRAGGSDPVFGIDMFVGGTTTGIHRGGRFTVSGAGDGYGVVGEVTNTGTTNYAVYGKATGAGTNYAGYFVDGHVALVNDNDTANELRFFEPSGSGSNYAAIKAPALAANYVLTLPTTDGNANEVLATDGSGILSWVAAPSQSLATVTGVGASTTTTVQLQNATVALELGKDDATNTKGILKMWSAGANNYSTIIQTGTQTQDVTYTLPLDDGTANQVLTTDGNGVLSWTTATGGASVWTDIYSSITRTGDATFTVTDNATNQEIFQPGRPLRYKVNSNATYRYGIVKTYVTGTVTIMGWKLDTSVQAMDYGLRSQVLVETFTVQGAFGDGTTSDLLADDNNMYYKWRAGNAFCVGAYAIDKTADTGASEPTLNVQIGNQDIFSAALTLSSSNATWVDTAVTIETTNGYYGASFDEEIELKVASAGTNGDALDLTVQLIFVLS